MSTDVKTFGIEPQDGSPTTTNQHLAAIEVQLHNLSALPEILVTLKETLDRLDQITERLDNIMEGESV